LGLKVWITRGSVISIGATIEIVSRFGRTAILSRLLVPSEFGTAVAITVVIGTAGLITDVAIDKFVMVRSDEDRALAAVHMLSLIRGALIALALIVSASNISQFFGVPQFSISFALIAIVPFVRSFGHLGIVQVQRTHNYFPSMLTQLLAQVAALVATLPAAYVLRDHRAILVILVIESLVYCVASHLLARKPYRLQSDRAVFFAALSFGIPLLANGIGLALFSQLDRILIGHWFDVSTLATYAVILNMTIVPIALIHRVLGTLGLSYVSSRMKGPSVLDDDYLALVFVWGSVAAFYALFVAVTLDGFIPLIFGSHFSVSPFVHNLIIVFSFSQVAKGAPVTLLIATGRTATLSLFTLVSGVGLIFAFILIHWWPKFEVVLLCIVIGDFLSYGLLFFTKAVWLGSRRSAVSIDAASSVGSLTVIVLSLWFSPELTFGARGIVVSVGLLAIIFQMAFGIPRHRALAHILRP
jgi:O-antigen/teichoic acid export membrane protein